MSERGGGARRVLVAGATGFVGRNLLPQLEAAGLEVVGGTRSPERSAAAQPERSWVELDVERPETLVPALTGYDALVYLVHGMADGGDYAAREQAAAEQVARAAAEAGVGRIVYLGGVAPAGEPSAHLASRLRTGELLRAGTVPTIELRAGMIVGSGSLSWQIVRDLALRLPAMVLPAWLATRSQPVAVRDICAAITHAVSRDDANTQVADLPGPEAMSAREVLIRIAALGGRRPLTISVPLLTPRLSSYWIRLVTHADYKVASQLVEGLTSDLLVEDPGYFGQMAGYQRCPFDDAARAALAADAATLSTGERVLEGVVRLVAPRAKPLEGPRALALGAAACLLLAASHLGADLNAWPLLGATAAAMTGMLLLCELERWRTLIPDLRELLVGGLVGGAMVGATFLLYPLFAELEPVAEAVPRLYERLRAPPGPWLMLPLILLVMAIEELVWRGVLIDELDRRVGPLLAMVGSLLLYMLPALAGGLVLAAIAGACGAAWTLERRATGRLAASYVSHVIWGVSVMILWPLY